jgi:DNA mismatch endonuclease (patch repair protein)
MPKSRLDFWLPKLNRNKERDAETQALLEEQGWKFMVVWECQLKNTQELASQIVEFLNN